MGCGSKGSSGSKSSESTSWDELRPKCSKNETQEEVVQAGPECHESHKDFHKKGKSNRKTIPDETVNKNKCEAADIERSSKKCPDSLKDSIDEEAPKNLCGELESNKISEGVVLSVAEPRASSKTESSKSACSCRERRPTKEGKTHGESQPCPPIKEESNKNDNCSDTQAKTKSTLESCACQSSQRKKEARPRPTQTKEEEEPSKKSRTCSSTRDQFQTKPSSNSKSKSKSDSCCSSNKTPTKTSSKSTKSSKELVKEDCGPAKDASAYSKLVDCCKNLAKQYVKPKSKPQSRFTATDMDLGNEDMDLRNDCDKRFGKIDSKYPCEPKAEKGTGCDHVAKTPCSVPSACPQLKKPSFADFFPLDARNKKLNDCIEKYGKIDPSQVISKCSQFASKVKGSSEKCETATQKCFKESQQPCSQETVKKCLAVTERPEFGVHRGFFSFTVPPTTRQLVGRWAPSAAAYLATSALVGLYVTEWKAVLRYVPGYTHLANEPSED